MDLKETVEKGRGEKKKGKESSRSILTNRTTHPQRSSWKVLPIPWDIGRCYVIKTFQQSHLCGHEREVPVLGLEEQRPTLGLPNLCPLR